jgi:tRNA-specific 2-thiouridylase
MSGGVDSAVAAARAVDAGHDVTGVHLALTHGRDGSGCCTADDARDAGRVADVLGIAFYVWDLADLFARTVVDDFVGSYAAGRTPNPCLRCNERVKFSAVLDRALALGFDGLVTGHHARIIDGALHRAVDIAKDQSYVLGTLRPERLRHAVFPVGDSTKATVRAEAVQRNLAVAGKPDSVDVCFAGRDTAGYLTQALGRQPGTFVDADSGAVVGNHDGAYAFTVGQRRGLGIGGGPARYVLGVEPVSRTVTVGSHEQLRVDVLEAVDSTYTGAAVNCHAQLRAHGAVHPAQAVPLPGARLRVELDQPAYGVAPGQAVVLYDADRVVGGAWIEVTDASVGGVRRLPGRAAARARAASA